MAAVLNNEEAISKRWEFAMNWCKERGLAPSVSINWGAAEDAYNSIYNKKPFHEELFDAVEEVKKLRAEVNELKSINEKRKLETPANTSDRKIKQCPFCTGTKIAVRATRGTTWVTCSKCLASGPTASSETEAIKKWNAVSMIVNGERT